MFFVALLGWGQATAAGTEQDLENGGGEAAGRPALRQPVLTDEQRDEIREAFDLYVPCRLCYFGSWRRARLCGSDELCDGLSMVAPFFVLLVLLLSTAGGCSWTRLRRWGAVRIALPLYMVPHLGCVPRCTPRLFCCS